VKQEFSARLVLDVQALQSEMHSERGIARYVRMLCKHLMPNLDSIEAFCLNPNRPYPKNVDHDLVYSGKLVWGNMAPIRSASAKGPAVYWRMSPFEMQAPEDTIHPRNILSSGAVVVAILYDLIPCLFPEVYLTDPVVKARYAHHAEMLRQSDLLLSISESAKADAVSRFGYPADRIAVIKAGVSEFFDAIDGADLDGQLIKSKIPELSRPFLYTVMGEDPRKNLDGLLKAFALLPGKLRAQHQLVVGGAYSGESIANIKQAVPAEIAERLVFPSHVDDATMRALYRNCALFVFPSKYEGFGLPLVEALACGATAITSNASSLPEIMEFPEATFHPDNAEEMAALMERGLSDRAFSRTIRNVGKVRVPMFRWHSVAEASMKAIEATVRGTSRHFRPGRPAIAMVGPFPPQRSGIADYNYYIAKELARFVDLFIFHAGPVNPEPLWSAGVLDVHPVESLGTEFSPHYFDRVLYTIGNSDHHVATLGKFLEYPGILWFHDVNLRGLYNVYGSRATGNGGPFLIERARRFYRHRCPPPVHNPQDSLLSDLDDWSIHYAVELVSQAPGVVVNSRLAYEMLRLDCGPHIVLPPTHIVPLATKRSGHTDVPSPFPKTAPFSIVSVGWVHQIKSPDLLIRAFAGLPRHLEAELVFIGGFFESTLEAELTNLTEHLGVAQTVRFLGYTDEAEWFEQIRRATCAVQLRRTSRGESSAAVLDCVSLGLPVITNVISCREMPPDSIVYVPSDCSVSELRDRLQELLTDHELQLRLREGALEYAETHNFEKTVRQLLRALFDVREGLEGGGNRFQSFLLPGPNAKPQVLTRQTKAELVKSRAAPERI
jgi:glycosyltransferase involved in cell wall biosynthesis